MPAFTPLSVIVLSGFSVSSEYYFERTERALVVQVPSWGSGLSVQPQFTATSGAAAVTYGPLQQPDLTGNAIQFACWSAAGPGWGIVQLVPAPHFRLALASAPSGTVSFTVYAKALS
jgi:hypothetical protein